MSQDLSPAESFADRALGAWLGLAVGDALGTTLEFSRRDSEPHHTEMIGGGPFRLQPGVWTDDTSMALCLADTLLATGEVDPRDLITRFISWWRDGEYSVTGSCFDIGNTTRAALERFERTGGPLAGNAAAPAAGNGSLMRLARSRYSIVRPRGGGPRRTSTISNDPRGRRVSRGLRGLRSSADRRLCGQAEGGASKRCADAGAGPGGRNSSVQLARQASRRHLVQRLRHSHARSRFVGCRPSVEI